MSKLRYKEGGVWKSIAPSQKEFDDNKNAVAQQLAEMDELKATKADVQQISLAYKESYATLAALQTAYPTGNIYNHAVLADGMIYTYTNSAWTNTGIQANGTGIAANSVTPDKTTFITQSTQNIFDPAKATDGYRLDASGLPFVDATSTLSEFIPVTAGKTYDLNVSGIWARVWRVAIYDTNKTFISKTLDTTPQDALLKLPIASDGYVRIAVSLSVKYRFQFVDSAVRNSFQKFEKKINSDIVLSTTKFSSGNNLINKAGFILGYYKAGATMLASGSYDLADSMQVDAGKKYYYKGFLADMTEGVGMRYAAFFDQNKAFISAINFNTEPVDSFSFTTPVNTKYVSVTVYKTNTKHVLSAEKINHYIVDEVIPKENLPSLSGDMFADESISTSKIKDFTPLANKLSPLYGKTILNFGDSIAQGGSNGGIGYAEIIASKYNMTVTNRAVGGSAILNTHTSVIQTQIDTAVSTALTADYILFNGVTNDANVVAANKVGAISIGYDATLDLTTYCGSFEHALKTLITKWMGKKIIYVVVHKISNLSDLALFATLVDLSKQMCRKWGIPYADVYDEGQLNTNITAMSTAYTSNADTKHPNQLGYELFYVPLIENKMKVR